MKENKIIKRHTLLFFSPQGKMTLEKTEAIQIKKNSLEARCSYNKGHRTGNKLGDEGIVQSEGNKEKMQRNFCILKALTPRSK